MAPSDRYYSVLKDRGYKLIKSDIGTSGRLFSKIMGIVQAGMVLYRFKPDIVLSFTIYPNFIFSLFRCFFKFRLITNITGLGSFVLDKRKGFLTVLIYKSIFIRSHHILFQNHYDLEYFSGTQLLRAGNHSVIPGSGIDLSGYSKSYDVPSELKFAFIGRFIVDKGLVEFFDAVSYLRDLGYCFKYEIYGGFSTSNSHALSKNYVEKMCDALNIQLKGFVEEREDIYKGLSAIILPSYREGTSKVLLEACASYIPCLTTDVPGCNNVILDGFNGFLCKPKDHRSLAEIIIKFSELAPSCRERLAENARLHVEKNFSEKIVIDKYSELVK
tara:strand:- start:1673 stop:2659 length:987 start_codon:yes stop_codon:yes gene_type:complete